MLDDILELAKANFRRIGSPKISTILMESLQRELQSSTPTSHPERSSYERALNWAFEEIRSLYGDNISSAERSLTSVYKKPDHGIPDDFDAEFYLISNKDLMNARIDPYFHYLNFGKHEDRAYRYDGPSGVRETDGVGRLVSASNSNISGWVVPDGAQTALVTLAINGLPVAKVKADSANFLYPHPGGPGRACGFVLSVHDQLRKLLPTANDVKAYLSDGRELPVSAEFRCQLSGNENATPHLLKEKLEQGHIISPKSGQVILPIRAWSTDKKRGLLRDVAYAAETARSRFGKSITIAYGTLLGAIREHDLLGHDDDIDVFILLDAADALSAGKEFASFRNELSASGFNLDSILDGGNFHWRFASGHSIDVFGLWSDGKTLNCYNAGFSGSMRDVLPTRSVALCEVEVSLPANPEQILAGIYGENWRVPDPSFQWKVSEETKLRMQKYIEGIRSVVTYE